MPAAFDVLRTNGFAVSKFQWLAPFNFVEGFAVLCATHVSRAKARFWVSSFYACSVSKFHVSGSCRVVARRDCTRFKAKRQKG
jgi:hypothetical protein